MDKVGNGQGLQAIWGLANEFEHELLDMILRMEQRRQLLLQQKEAAGGQSKTKKQKKRSELKKLVTDLNHDKGGGRYHKSHSR